MKPSVFIISLLVAACSANSVFSTPIRFVGSDLFAETIGSEVQRFAKASDSEVEVSLRSSRVGLDALEAGQADLGLLVLGADDPSPSPKLTSVKAGYLTLVIVAPASVALSQLNFGQLAGVFGSSESSNFKRWGELGITGPWSARSIAAMVVKRDGLSLDLFRYNVMTKPELKSTVIYFDGVQELYARLRSEEGGLAIVATPPENMAGLKVLLVAKNEHDVAYGPTSENLNSGDYPLRLPVYLVFRKGDAKRLNFTIRHLLADESAPLLLQAGVVPMPVQARNQIVFDLENF